MSLEEQNLEFEQELLKSQHKLECVQTIMNHLAGTGKTESNIKDILSDAKELVKFTTGK